MTPLDFIRAYGTAEFRFDGYNKYRFWYSSNDGWTVAVGGTPDAIYRARLDEQMLLWQLLDEVGTEYASAVRGDDDDTEISLSGNDVWDVVMELRNATRRGDGE